MWECEERPVSQWQCFSWAMERMLFDQDMWLIWFWLWDSLFWTWRKHSVNRCEDQSDLPERRRRRRHRRRRGASAGQHLVLGHVHGLLILWPLLRSSAELCPLLTACGDSKRRLLTAGKKLVICGHSISWHLPLTCIDIRWHPLTQLTYVYVTVWQRLTADSLRPRFSCPSFASTARRRRRRFGCGFGSWPWSTRSSARHGVCCGSWATASWTSTKATSAPWKSSGPRRRTHWKNHTEVTLSDLKRDDVRWCEMMWDDVRWCEMCPNQFEWSWWQFEECLALRRTIILPILDACSFFVGNFSVSFLDEHIIRLDVYALTRQ